MVQTISNVDSLTHDQIIINADIYSDWLSSNTDEFVNILKTLTIEATTTLAGNPSAFLDRFKSQLSFDFPHHQLFSAVKAATCTNPGAQVLQVTTHCPKHCHDTGILHSCSRSLETSSTADRYLVRMQRDLNGNDPEVIVFDFCLHFYCVSDTTLETLRVKNEFLRLRGGADGDVDDRGYVEWNGGWYPPNAMVNIFGVEVRWERDDYVMNALHAFVSSAIKHVYGIVADVEELMGVRVAEAAQVPKFEFLPNVTGLNVLMGSCAFENLPLAGAVDTMASGKRKAQKKRKASAITIDMNEELDSTPASSTSSLTRRFRDDVVALTKDGQLLLDGVFKFLYSNETMTILGSLGIRLDKLKLARDGYVMGSKSGGKVESLHTLVAAPKRDVDHAALSAAGCPDLKKTWLSLTKMTTH